MFIIYINGLDLGISREVSKFADNTKLGKVIRTDEDARELQGDLDRLYDWTRKWQMEFNTGKCSILSVGRNNPLHNYSLNATPIKRSHCERHLGVLVSSDLRPKNQCIQAKNLANRVLGFITRSVSNRSAAWKNVPFSSNTNNHTVDAALPPTEENANLEALVTRQGYETLMKPQVQ